jgi:hypothetical protein
MAPKIERPYMTRQQFWKLAAWFVSAAIVASPTIGHLGVAVVIGCLYVIRRTWLKRPLPAHRHVRLQVKR